MIGPADMPETIGVCVVIMKTFSSAAWRKFALLITTCLFAGAVGAQALPSATSTPGPAPSADQPVDSVVAIVNNDVITARELSQRVGLIQRRLQQQGAPVPPLHQMQLQVLDQMVLERIQLQKAKDDSIVVDDSTLQATLQRLAQANNMSIDTYRARLEQEGVPWTMFTGDARTELLLSRLREREVDSKITVSDAEVANYIASQRGPTANLPNDLRFEHILVKVPANAPDQQVADARAKAQALLLEAQGDTNFERLAKRNSQDADASKGGDLGFKSPDVLPPAYVKAASTLRPGQVAPDLVRTDNGFEVLKLVDRQAATGRNGDTPKLTQTHVRHILLRVGEGVSEDAARQKLIDVRAQLEAGGDFAKFASTYSQDGSAQNGGDLGWISPGETVPEFERVMNQLQDGQISPPVRTEYGYHLIQVLGRRDAPGSATQQLDTVRQAIGQRKAEQAFSDWLRQLRDSAYVQYKLDNAVS
jgi:peptidyl-prolyl cis-trans isomerase SurA